MHVRRTIPGFVSQILYHWQNFVVSSDWKNQLVWTNRLECRGWPLGGLREKQLLEVDTTGIVVCG